MRDSCRKVCCRGDSLALLRLRKRPGRRRTDTGYTALRYPPLAISPPILPPLLLSSILLPLPRLCPLPFPFLSLPLSLQLCMPEIPPRPGEGRAATVPGCDPLNHVTLSCNIQPLHPFPIAPLPEPPLSNLPLPPPLASSPSFVVVVVVFPVSEVVAFPSLCFRPSFTRGLAIAQGRTLEISDEVALSVKFKEVISYIHNTQTQTHTYYI